VPEAKPGNWLAGKDRASEVTMNDLTTELRLRGLEPPYDVVKQELAISQRAAADGLAVTGGRQRRRRFKARPYSCWKASSNILSTPGSTDLASQTSQNPIDTATRQRM
jgi:hypothetical protein